MCSNLWRFSAIQSTTTTILQSTFASSLQSPSTSCTDSKASGLQQANWGILHLFWLFIIKRTNALRRLYIQQDLRLQGWLLRYQRQMHQDAWLRPADSRHVRATQLRLKAWRCEVLLRKVHLQ